MALFIKQDFTPPILSRRWIAIKCRPNMLLSCREHVICVLESGLLFREDSACVERAAPAAEAVWRAVGAGYTGWLTRGERWLAVAAVLACVAAAPPTVTMGRRGACARLAAYACCAAATRAAHCRLARAALPALLALQREYTALARRAMACLKEYRHVHRGLESMSAVLDAALSLLWRQQSSLAVLMSRCSSALLGNLPWLYEDVSWDSIAAVQDVKKELDESELVKIHHAFLVVQSTLLKHVAMAHFIQPPNLARTYINHNERLYWLHNHLLAHLHEELKDNYEALDRMYRLLKNSGTSDLANTVKRSGIVMNDSWLYSDVHGGIARATMELKMALNKCTSLDVFLDSCAMNREEFDVDILNNDIEGLIDELTVCLTTVQNSQMKLKKLRSKFNPDKAQHVLKPTDENEEKEDENVLMIEDKDPETHDEVFFFIKTEDEVKTEEPMVDVTTGPGKKERDATKIVLGELKKKLVKREDVMRQREKVALEKKMPELKGKFPDFPRQMCVVETGDLKKSIFNKFNNRNNNRNVSNAIMSKSIKHLSQNAKPKLAKRFQNCVFSRRTYNGSSVIMHPFLSVSQRKMLPLCKQSTLKINCKNTITLSVNHKRFILITKWVNTQFLKPEKDFDSSSLSEGLSDVENNAINDTIHEATNKQHNGLSQNVARNSRNEVKNEKFSKEDLALSASSSESDFDFYKERKEQLSLLKDIRRHRVARKKNHPSRRSISIEKEAQNPSEVDEGLRPVEYSFGTGMALASVFQGQNGKKLPTLGSEEVFIGDGEVSSDSGNDENS